jgi:hypothetical protein
VTIDIIGTGPTASFYDWPEGVEKWSVGAAFPSYGADIDLYFCFHDEPVDIFNKSDISYLNMDSYPLDKIVKYFGSRYFTSSIAYMLALAIKRKPKQINLWGVDCEEASDYAFERPCVLYWIGQAEARGIDVTTSSGLAESSFMYGYENMDMALHQLEMRRAHSEAMARKTEGREHDQWIGKMLAFNHAKNIIRS